jgi:hypothetical protein
MRLLFRFQMTTSPGRIVGWPGVKLESRTMTRAPFVSAPAPPTGASAVTASAAIAAQDSGISARRTI